MQRSTVVVGTTGGILVVAALLMWSGVWIQFLDPGSYERTTVTVVDENGSELGAVDARVADTWQKRLVGLSRTESLGPDEGMVFVHDDEQRRAFVMREMSFPLDIVFVAENGTITQIHHAPVPSAGTGESDLEEYAGVGTYVLEVNRGWTNETGTSVGDQVRIPDETAGTVAPGDDSSQSTDSSAIECDAGPTDGLTSPTTTVVALDEDCSERSTVSVTITNNSSEGYTGLSDTE
jgi:uncharacterized membrane protein (UPF0127 family)